MKRSVVWILLSYSVLGVAAVPARAQETKPEKETLVVEPGNDFRVALEKGVRLKAVGQPITAKLLEPVYAGEMLAIPAGSTIKGHVSAISTAPHKRARRLLNGDFTPPKTAHVTFDQLVLSDGTTVPIHSDSAVGLGCVANSQYLPKAQRPGIRQKLKGATAPLREPHKLQRLGEAVVTSLPYHPEYIDQGTVFDTALLEPVTLLVPVQPDTTSPQIASDYLHLHLLTPINSSTSTAGTQIEAVVSQPYYQADHQLLYPAGTRITGTVQKASSAGWMKRNGSIVFAFRSVQMPDGTTRDLHSTVGGIQAERSEGLDVGKEGEIKATTSTFARLLAPVSLVGPSRAVADTTLQKTAWSRSGSGEGRKGFGLLGAGAAQASAGAAIGFGYFGAAKRLCDAFIAKGSNVELPVNTPIFLRLDSDDPSVALATR